MKPDLHTTFATPVTGKSIWVLRAERLLQQACGEAGDTLDAIAIVSAALTALRVDLGELPESEMDGYSFPGEDDNDEPHRYHDMQHGWPCRANAMRRG